MLKEVENYLLILNDLRNQVKNLRLVRDFARKRWPLRGS
jgi:hypothetical protein